MASAIVQCLVPGLDGTSTTAAAREEMGLPQTFVDRQPALPLAVDRDLLTLLPARLVEIVEGPDQPFERRLAAGALLALAGDPRIDVFDPTMVDVPAGVATIGTDPDVAAEVASAWGSYGVVEDWIRKECPRHEVAVEAFRIARYPVTNEEYREFLADADSSAFPTSWAFGVYPAHAANHPVWTVSAEAADAYAEWLSGRTGRDFRLPTETEWEYAASGGGGREYPWGDRFDPACANTVEEGPLTTTPVGAYPRGRSPFGVDDVAGNVEEWVATTYAPYPGGDFVHDHLTEDGETYRITRGGCFTRFGDLTRCQRRHGRSKAPIYAVGFRLAESV